MADRILLMPNIEGRRTPLLPGFTTIDAIERHLGDFHWIPDDSYGKDIVAFHKRLHREGDKVVIPHVHKKSPPSNK